MFNSSIDDCQEGSPLDQLASHSTFVFLIVSEAARLS